MRGKRLTRLTRLTWLTRAGPGRCRVLFAVRFSTSLPAEAPGTELTLAAPVARAVTSDSRHTQETALRALWAPGLGCSCSDWPAQARAARQRRIDNRGSHPLLYKTYGIPQETYGARSTPSAQARKPWASRLGCRGPGFRRCFCLSARCVSAERGIGTVLGIAGGLRASPGRRMSRACRCWGSKAGRLLTAALLFSSKARVCHLPRAQEHKNRIPNEYPDRSQGSRSTALSNKRLHRNVQKQGHKVPRHCRGCSAVIICIVLFSCMPFHVCPQGTLGKQEIEKAILIVSWRTPVCRAEIATGLDVFQLL